MTFCPACGFPLRTTERNWLGDAVHVCDGKGCGWRSDEERLPSPEEFLRKVGDEEGERLL